WPPVSMTVARQPPNSAEPWIRSRVTPGVSRTIALRLPIRRLKSVDFPTFGRHTIATTGNRTGAAPSRRRGRPAEQTVDESARARFHDHDRNLEVPSQVIRQRIVEEDALGLGQRHAGHQYRIAQRAPGKRPRDVLARQRPRHGDRAAEELIRHRDDRDAEARHAESVEEPDENRAEQLARHDRHHPLAPPAGATGPGRQAEEIVLEPPHEADPVLDDGEVLVRGRRRNGPARPEGKLVRREDGAGPRWGAESAPAHASRGPAVAAL